MLGAEVSAPRVLRTLRQLNDQLPEGRPLSAVKVIVDGDRVVVKDRLAAWEPETGQGTLNFDVRAISKRIAPQLGRAPKIAPHAANDSVEELYQTALDLELAGRGDAAREAYRQVLTLDPKLVAAPRESGSPAARRWRARRG